MLQLLDPLVSEGPKPSLIHPSKPFPARIINKTQIVVEPIKCDVDSTLPLILTTHTVSSFDFPTHFFAQDSMQTDTFNPSLTYTKSINFSRNAPSRSITFKSHLFSFLQHTSRNSLNDTSASLHSRQALGRGVMDDICDLALPLIPNLFSGTGGRTRSNHSKSNKIKLKFA